MRDVYSLSDSFSNHSNLLAEFEKNTSLKQKYAPFKLATPSTWTRLKHSSNVCYGILERNSLSWFYLVRPCIHYNSALVIQVVKYFSVPLDLHMMIFASVTAGRLSKLCFCVLTCIQLDMDQNKFILPFYHYN